MQRCRTVSVKSRSGKNRVRSAYHRFGQIRLFVLAEIHANIRTLFVRKRIFFERFVTVLENRTDKKRNFRTGILFGEHAYVALARCKAFPKRIVKVCGIIQIYYLVVTGTACRSVHFLFRIVERNVKFIFLAVAAARLVCHGKRQPVAVVVTNVQLVPFRARRSLVVCARLEIRDGARIAFGRLRNYVYVIRGVVRVGKTHE